MPDGQSMSSTQSIVDLAVRAASGAGFSATQADQFGHATAFFLAQGGAYQELRDALRDTGDSPVLRLPLLLDYIQRAISLAGPDVELTLHPGDETLAPAYACLLPMQLIECRVIRPEIGQSRLALRTNPGVDAKDDLPKGRVVLPDALRIAFENWAASGSVK